MIVEHCSLAVLVYFSDRSEIMRGGVGKIASWMSLIVYEVDWSVEGVTACMKWTGQLREWPPVWSGLVSWGSDRLYHFSQSRVFIKRHLWSSINCTALRIFQTVFVLGLCYLDNLFQTFVYSFSHFVYLVFEMDWSVEGVTACMKWTGQLREWQPVWRGLVSWGSDRLYEVDWSV